MLEVKNLSKHYANAKIKACDNISFNLDKLGITSLLGLNGAGKSSLINCITGYYPPDSGDVFIEGFSVSKNELETKKRIGVLYEQTPLYSTMTVYEFLLFCAEMRSLDADFKEKKVNELIEFWELEEYSDRIIKNLSKGYKQRVGLAQSLIHNPPFLILDEPTSGLDAVQIRNMEDKLYQLAKEKSILISTHNLRQAAELCSNHILINKGRIIAQGNIEEIKEQLESAGCEFKADTAVSVLEEAFMFFAGVNKNDFRKI